MSMPTIPDIQPKIDLKREDIINMLLASIALEEIGLAHIINAEAEKIQQVIACKGKMENLLEIDKSVDRVLKDIIKKEIILEFKFDNILDLIKDKKKECCD